MSLKPDILTKKLSIYNYNSLLVIIDNYPINNFYKFFGQLGSSHPVNTKLKKKKKCLIVFDECKSLMK